MSIASAGMRAASLGMQAAAANVARLSVEGAPRIRTAQIPVVGGGVEIRLAEGGSDPGAPMSDLLAAKEAVLAFTANATVLRRSDQMLGALLDEHA